MSPAATSRMAACGVIASVTCGAEAQSIRDEVLERGKVVQQAFVERFERAKAEGDLPAHIDVEGLTDLLKALLQGISVQASAGATREELERLVDTGLIDVAERLILSASSNFFIDRYRKALDAPLSVFVLNGIESSSSRLGEPTDRRNWRCVTVI